MKEEAKQLHVDLPDDPALEEKAEGDPGVRFHGDGYKHGKAVDVNDIEEKEDHVVFHPKCIHCGKEWTETGPLTQSGNSWW